MKRYIIWALLALTVSMSAMAQAKATSPAKPTRAERLEQRANHVAQQLKLDDKTHAWFVPLYVAYQDTLQGLHRACPLRQQGTCQQRLTDEQVTQLLEYRMQRDEQRAAIRRAYYAKFSKHLNPQQLLTLFSRSHKGGFKGMPGRGCRQACQPQHCRQMKGCPAKSKKGNRSGKQPRYWGAAANSTPNN